VLYSLRGRSPSRNGGGGAQLSNDNLTAHNRLQGGPKPPPTPDMVFLSPMDLGGVRSMLDEYSAVDASLPLDLDKMPKMPLHAPK
jgi:hypothetical protein